MTVEFRKAVVPEEVRSLSAFDRKVFESDHFLPSDWKRYQCWWMLVGGKKTGCCAFQEHIDFREDIGEENPAVPGSLYISTTGILPDCRGRGLGQLLKSWQIAYAHRHGFTRIVTNVRKRNAAMLALNRKFGFRVLRTTPRYYADPVDSTVVLELIVTSARDC